jgi:hypothetical protein
MTSICDMWCALINIYKGNNQVETEMKDSHSESENKQKQNLTLMVNDKEVSSPNIIHDIIVVSKNKEMKSK